MKSRQLEILLYLLDIKKTTCAVLAQRFEVSQRTILRDLDKLSAMGVPVWTQPGYEGGVFLSPNYRFDRSFFTTEEIGDIILAFHMLPHSPLGQQASFLFETPEVSAHCQRAGSQYHGPVLLP